MVGHYVDGVRPGYIIRSLDSLSSRTVIFSAGNSGLEATRIETKGNHSSRSPEELLLKRALTETDTVRLLSFLHRAGIL